MTRLTVLVLFLLTIVMVGRVWATAESVCSLPTTIFCEDFENETNATLPNFWPDGCCAANKVITTTPANVFSGSKALESTWSPGPGGGAGSMTRWFRSDGQPVLPMTGYDHVFARAYVKIENTFTTCNPDCGKFFVLYGSRLDAPYSGLGQAGIKPTGTSYFYSGVATDQSGPRNYIMYDYDPDMTCSPDPNCFGQQILLSPTTQAPLDTWICLESEVQLNTVGQHDGIHRVWVNDTLMGQRTAVRWRDTTNLSLDAFQLSFSGDPPVTTRVWVDNIVVATQRIGCTITPAPAAPTGLTINKYYLTATVASADGVATGTVTGTGINCGTDCNEALTPNTSATLTATPGTNSRFTGWSRDCSGTGQCQVTMSGPRNVTATFSSQYQLTVTLAGSGTGTVNATGIVCPGDCVETYPAGTMVTLSEGNVPPGSVFIGWSGDCIAAAPTCTVTMDQVKNVTATFAIAGGCPCTVWANSVTPDIIANNDPQAIEVGTVIRSDRDGYITGARFYKSLQNTGTHVGKLWTIGGSLLASVTFTNETGSGWQQQSFPSPIPISANTNYVISYHTDVGFYSVTVGYFNTTVDNAPLHAPADTPSVHNGRFSYGASVFPTNTFNASNYWVDVVFEDAPNQFLLAVATSGDIGGGTITGTGISCGTDCAEFFSPGVPVTLTANPAAGFNFTGWGGDCSGTQTTCNLTMNQAHSASATFTAQTSTAGLTAQCQTDFGGAAFTDGQECVTRYAAVIQAENWEQGRTTTCMNTESFPGSGFTTCPAKWKSPVPLYHAANWNTINTPPVTAPDGTKAVEANIPVGTIFVPGANNFCCNPNAGGGFNDWANLNGSNGAQRHLFFRYYFMIGTDFDTSTVNDNKIWETKNSFTSSDQLFLGHYNAPALEVHVIRDGIVGQPRITQNVGTPIPLVKGQWQCIEFDVTMNTETGGVPNFDGQILGWINDQLKFNWPNTPLVHYNGGPQDLGFFRLTNSGFTGPNGGSISGHRYVDRIVIATQRIGC